MVGAYIITGLPQPRRLCSGGLLYLLPFQFPRLAVGFDTLPDNLFSAGESDFSFLARSLPPVAFWHPSFQHPHVSVAGSSA